MGSTGRDGSERATQATASASASRSTMIRIPCRLQIAHATLHGASHAYSHEALTFPRVPATWGDEHPRDTTWMPRSCHSTLISGIHALRPGAGGIGVTKVAFWCTARRLG